MLGGWEAGGLGIPATKRNQAVNTCQDEQNPGDGWVFLPHHARGKSKKSENEECERPERLRKDIAK